MKTRLERGEKEAKRSKTKQKIIMTLVPIQIGID